MAKALALFSGGLDSILAVMLIRKQGIIVEGITFNSIFYDIQTAKKEAKKIHLPLHIIDFNETILNLVQNPQYGYGKNLNPCIDCHLWMVKKTKELMKKLKADFIITGEVVGERPKSQKYTAMNLITNKSETKDILLRPLSALKLKPTSVEKSGLVDRDKLLGITGRSRKPQIRLAQELNITNFPTPAGGCLLTVPSFSDRLKVHLKMQKLSLEDIEPLKFGRHFLSNDDSAKIIIGRDAKDNLGLLGALKSPYYFIFTENWTGPVTVIIFYQNLIENLIHSAGSLHLRYSKLRTKGRQQLYYTSVKTEAEKKTVLKFYKDNNFEDFKKQFNFKSFWGRPEDYKNLNLKRI